MRPAPKGYEWVQSVNQAIIQIQRYESLCDELLELVGGAITLIDLNHDLGEFADDGGDGIKLLDWLEETGRDYPIRIHSMNPVGRDNMRRIIERNGWTEVY